MQSIKRVAVCACALALSVQASAVQPEAIHVPRYETRGPGAAVLVRRQDKDLVRQAYGQASIELDVRMRPDHVFRIGSISKTFTAVAVMQLAERGLLVLTDPVRRYLPSLPASWEKVTVEHLLAHASGIPNLEEMSGFAAFQTQEHTLDEVIDWFSNQALAFEPGTATRYSSSGYIVLGKLIESLSGQRYQDYLQQHILQPLGLRHTAYGTETNVVPDMVDGYRDRHRKAGFISMSVPHGAGALVSNADDLAAFTLALHGGKLVSRASYLRMITPYRTHDGAQAEFGYGLVLRTVGGQRLLGHSGAIEGFSADVEYEPASKTVVVVLQNSQDDPERASRVALALMAQATGKALPAGRAVPVSPARLRALVGTYPTVNSSRVIGMENGHLTESLNAGAPTVLSMASSTEAFVPGSDRRLLFTLENGRAISVQPYRGSEPDGNPAMRGDEAQPMYPMDAATFADLAGQYQLTDRLQLMVSQQDGRFFLQATGQPALEIFPHSPTRFSARDVLISVEFKRDASGKISHLMFYQGDVAIPAPRK